MNSIEMFKAGSFNASIDIPGMWNELEEDELLCISENILLPYSKQEYFYSVVFVFILNYRAKRKSINLPKDFFLTLNAEDVAIYQHQALEWIHQDNTLTKQLIERIYLNTPGMDFLYGPLESFNDLTCGEFEDSEVFSHLYNQDKSFDHLNMIAAILFRPRSDGRRVPYITNDWNKIPHPVRDFYKEEDDMIIYNAEKIKSLFSRELSKFVFATFLWYAGCRSQLTLVFPHVFGGYGKGTPDLAAFTKCIHAGAGPKNGTRDKIRRSLLKAFLMDIEQDAIYAEELQKNTK